MIATPATAPQTVIGTRRRSAGNSRLMNARVCGVIAAAPRPCTARAAISEPAEPASPHQSEAPVKITSPAISTRLGPNRSPSRPVSSSGTVLASR